MKHVSLNGEWLYRIGNGKLSPITVPFSRLPVGHSECLRSFDLSEQADRLFLKFDGITYYASVFLNGAELGEMLPYCEYEFEITDLVKPANNELKVVLEDIDRAFGPTAGWENFGGIIRDVQLIYRKENYLKDVFFYTDLFDHYKAASFTVETTTQLSRGDIKVELLYKDENIFTGQYPATQARIVGTVEHIKLWSPDAPELYELKVTLFENNTPVDVYTCKVGFREFTCERHRFLLNGKPLFLKGVCKHEMIGDNGHCPTEDQMLSDMQMIKDTGCNFVRLVHYPHNKKILDIADQLGLMVSEEPGLWWSDTADPQVSAGALEVMRRTIQRDKNHPAIVFWLSFNECRFTEQYLIDSARLCRQCDPTRLVSGANCMSNEDTLKYYNICGFDFYTMHPYAQTIDRAMKSAETLNDKPLLFTEWGGHFVYDNPKLLKEFLNAMYQLYLDNSDNGALAGAFFWEWSEVNDFNRGRPACIDGNLAEGLVDKYRKPRLIYNAFCEALADLGKEPEDDFWLEQTAKDFEVGNTIECCGNPDALNKLLTQINESEKVSGKVNKRRLKNGPVLHGVKSLNDIPVVLQDNACISLQGNFNTNKISLWGMTSIVKGYPLGGAYGESVAKVLITYEDNEQESFVLRNGEDITTVFALNNSSRIDPIAENAKRIAVFGYDKNFEHYVLNQIELHVNADKRIETISICSENNGYALLIHGISYDPLN